MCVKLPNKYLILRSIDTPLQYGIQNNKKITNLSSSRFRSANRQLISMLLKFKSCIKFNQNETFY